MKKKLLVIGAGGFLGEHVQHAGNRAGDIEVICADRPGAGMEEVEITDAVSVEWLFDRIAPDQVLLLAAISDIDRCESQPELAYAVNVRGAENVAQACARRDARLLYTSSAAVFDGTRHGYAESDEPTPLSVYGRTKQQAEQAVLGLCPTAVALRIALVLGFAGRAQTNSMFDSFRARWEAGKAVVFPTYELRNPIDAGRLSEAMLALLGNPDLHGIYQIGARDSISRYDLGLRLAERMGFSSALVQPQQEPIPGRAPRGADHFLLTDRIRRDCAIELDGCEQIIERCFA